MKYYAGNPICKTDERAVLAEGSWDGGCQNLITPTPFPPLYLQTSPCPPFSWCIRSHLGSAKHPETVDSPKGSTALTFTVDDSGKGSFFSSNYKNNASLLQKILKVQKKERVRIKQNHSYSHQTATTIDNILVLLYQSGS